MEIIFEKYSDKIVESNWEASWQPKDKKQWKDGRSSKELAKFASSESFKELILCVLKACNIEEQNFKCEPEAKASLGNGFGTGGCRNHDLLMIGDKDCVIGVEAKVSEPFDEKMKIKKGKQGKDKHGNTRADKLANILCGNNINYEEIGYQLFTATYGTMKEAYNQGKDHCIMLFIVFKGNVCKEPNYDKHCAENNTIFENFCKFVNLQNGLIKRTIIDRTITCWIKKVEVIIGTNYSINS